MTRRARGAALAMALAMALPLAGCGDASRPDVDLGGQDLGPDRYSMVSEDGNARMGLTDRVVYFGLSDEARERAGAELRENADREGLKGMIGGVVQKTVGKALGMRMMIPVAEIEDIRWENGEMRFVFTDPERELGDSFRVNDRPLGRAFAQDRVLEFSAAFRSLKREQTTPVEPTSAAEPAPRPGAPPASGGPASGGPASGGPASGGPASGGPASSR